MVRARMDRTAALHALQSYSKLFVAVGLQAFKVCIKGVCSAALQYVTPTGCKGDLVAYAFSIHLGPDTVHLLYDRQNRPHLFYTCILT